MTSTLVDEYPFLLYQLLFFPVDVSVIVIIYLTLIRLIVVSFFGIFDRVFPGWDPVPDPHTPSLRIMLRRCPKNSPQCHRCNCCLKSYNHQWSRRRIYPFRLRNFQYQPPDIVPKDHLPESAMPLLLSVFCITSGVERWCHRWAQFIAETPIGSFIHTYCFYVRRRRDTPVFRAYSGTVREADRPRSI